MLKTRLLCLIVIVLGLSATNASAQGTKIAVANPARILDGMKEREDAQKYLDGLLTDLRKQEGEKRTALVDLENKAKALQPGTPQHQQIVDELVNKSIEFEFWVKKSQADAQRQQKQTMVTLYDKIVKMIEQIATKKGFELVITEQIPEVPTNFMNLTVDQIRAIILQRTPLYRSKSIDISDEVILNLNKDYLSKPPTTR